MNPQDKSQTPMELLQRVVTFQKLIELLSYATAELTKEAVAQLARYPELARDLEAAQADSSTPLGHAASLLESGEIRAALESKSVETIQAILDEIAQQRD